MRSLTFPRQAIELSFEELDQGVLAPSNLALAAALLTCRGYVILKNAFEPEVIERISSEVSDIYEDCTATYGASETATEAHAVPKVQLSEQKGASFWYRKSRWRIFPRLTGPMADPRLLANPFATRILEAMLGSDFYCKFVSSDTCLRGSILQSPHSDIVNGDMFEDNRWRARGYIVNVPTTECGLHNGPLEIWPGGSHLWSDQLLERFGLSPYVQDGRNPPVERAAEYFGSIKVVLHPGELLIRDLAMWHRGTPNPLDEPRTMLTIAYFRGGQEYGYGDPAMNLDRALFRKLDPRVQRLFRHHFSLADSLRRRRETLRVAVRGARAWIKGSLSAA